VGLCPVLNEHRLRLADRAVTPARGTGGPGVSGPPLAGVSERSDGVPRRGRGGPRPSASRWRCATWCRVNALVDGPFLVQNVARVPGGEGEGARRRAGVGPGAPRCVTRWVRQVGVRVDANGAWDVETAVVMIAKLARVRPSSTWSSRARRSRSWPRYDGASTCASRPDECIRSLDDARALRAASTPPTLIVLKQQPLGGVARCARGRRDCGGARGS